MTRLVLLCVCVALWAASHSCTWFDAPIQPEFCGELPALNARAAPTCALVPSAAAVVATDTFKHSFPCPSLPYWLIATAVIPAAAVVLLGVRWHLMAKCRQREAEGYDAVEGDIHWDSKTTLLYPALCTTAGVCAGLFGVGGEQGACSAVSPLLRASPCCLGGWFLPVPSGMGPHTAALTAQCSGRCYVLWVQAASSRAR